MNKRTLLLENAQRLYVIDQMTINEVAQRVGVNERTIRRWKSEYHWDSKRADYIQSKTMFHEELFNFARKLMATIEYDMDNKQKVDPGRMFTLSKLLPMISKIKSYEDDVAKKHIDEQNKGITPDFVKLIESEILGIQHSDDEE